MKLDPIQKEPYIKIIVNGREYNYTEFQWDLAWFAAAAIGFIAGVLCGVIISM